MTTPSDARRDAPRDAEALRAQKKVEIAISKKYRDDVAPRIVFEAVWGVAAWAGTIALAMHGWLPYWAACLLNGWIAYLMYMPLHEATHGNVVGRHPQLNWLNDLVGHVSSVPLIYSYRAHRISHMKHHAYANDPERDPDYFVAGPVWALIPKNLILTVLQHFVPIMRLVPSSLALLPPKLRTMAQVSAERRSVEEREADQFFIRSCAAVFVLLSLSGYFVEALLLWWLPARIGMALMTFFFAWLPHHPHAEQSRYRSTRATLFPGSRLLIRGQDRHLLHHLFPRVPHYRLPALFAEMRPHLEAHGARIEGPLAGEGAPPILMLWDPELVEELRQRDIALRA